MVGGYGVCCSRGGRPASVGDGRDGERSKSTARARRAAQSSGRGASRRRGKQEHGAYAPCSTVDQAGGPASDWSPRTPLARVWGLLAGTGARAHGGGRLRAWSGRSKLLPNGDVLGQEPRSCPTNDRTATAGGRGHARPITATVGGGPPAAGPPLHRQPERAGDEDGHLVAADDGGWAVGGGAVALDDLFGGAVLDVLV